ncbi:MAG: N-acetylmuramoyl-L-alanine amidase [Chloroflexi bacterium]|nr:N-acetylmuramoyl-L-alanine amidase [Chloroflexota bacterium]
MGHDRRTTFCHIILTFILTLALVLLTGCTAATKSPTAGEVVSIATSPPSEVTLDSGQAQGSALSPDPSPAPTQHSSPDAAPAAASAAASTPQTPATAQSPRSDGVAATGEADAGNPDEMLGEIAPLPTWTAGPTEGNASETTGALSAGPRKKVVALDPGHGGPEVGSAAPGLAEKNVNLAIALRLADVLRAEDYEVVLTRGSDRSVSPDYQGGGYPGVGRDLQARIDIANAASADLFISIHNNGSNDSSLSGTEVWYDSLRDFADQNWELANLVLEGLLEQIRALGYPVVNRGLKDDANFRIFRGRAYNIYVLGPGNGSRPHVPTQMPGVLGESLFLSNSRDAAMLRQDSTLDAIAAGYRDAIVAYFERHPE